MARYNHMFAINFIVLSDHPEGRDVTAHDLRRALLGRIIELDSVTEPEANHFEWLDAVGSPADSYEMRG